MNKKELSDILWADNNPLTMLMLIIVMSTLLTISVIDIVDLVMQIRLPFWQTFVVVLVVAPFGTGNVKYVKIKNCGDEK